MLFSHKNDLIGTFAQHRVAANLLMIMMILAGVWALAKLNTQFFPNFALDRVTVRVVWTGAAAEDVEESITHPLERELRYLDGLKNLTSTSSNGIASLSLEFEEGTDIGQALDDVKQAVDQVRNLPTTAEKPEIVRVIRYDSIARVVISGPGDRVELRHLARRYERELLARGIARVDITGLPEEEIAIQLSTATLRELGLSLPQVAERIGEVSRDLPAGAVGRNDGARQLRSLDQRRDEAAFTTLPLKAGRDGALVTLGDVATIERRPRDGEVRLSFHGRPAVELRLQRTETADSLRSARILEDWLAETRPQLPAGVELTVFDESWRLISDRIFLLLKNGGSGLALVVAILFLFLNGRVATWVAVGIPVSFMATLGILYAVGGSINMISLFALIMALGIIVDDAIIMGESAYSEQELHGHSVQSVVAGVYKVATPATFGVLTTIVAFAPTLFVEGVFGAFPEACGTVVVLCLAFSLVESKWILPAHLAHSRPTQNPLLQSVNRLQQRCNEWLRQFVEYRYSPLMRLCIENRYSCLAFFVSLLILCSGLLAGGQVRTILAPEARGEFLKAELRLAHGTPEERTEQALTEVANALFEVEADYQRDTGSEEKLVEHIAAYGFEQVNGRISVELTKEDRRNITTREVEQRWRQKVGTIHGAEVLAISGDDEGEGWGPAIAFDLMHHDFNSLKAASDELEEALRHYAGLYDIRNGAGDTADEFHLDILPEAESLGLTRYALGMQVRHAFYGAEAQRVQRGVDEVKVMVRYPRADREMTSSLANMFIRTPEGDEVPFETVAKLDVTQGLLKTTHIDFQRASEVTAEADKERVEPAEVVKEIEEHVMPGLLQKYPGLSYGISGMADEERKLGVSLMVGFGLAILGIYALLAIPTRSYLQPLIIMGVIPFGFIGAVVGHWVTGYAFSMMSMIGVIALSGVVVNDSLLLVDYTNTAMSEGKDRYSAVTEATTRRFRAIMLTSVTTFMGLAPMLLERSVQAQDIIPMAISLAFGIVFATVITLLLVPCLYLMLDDLARWWAGAAPTSTPRADTGAQDLASE